LPGETGQFVQGSQTQGAPLARGGLRIIFQALRNGWFPECVKVQFHPSWCERVTGQLQRSYIHYIEGFASHYGISPQRLGLDDIRNYQLHLIEQRQLSPQTINCFSAAAKFLYTITLDMPWTDEHFTRLKVPTKLPVVLSAAEVEEFFRHIGVLKHRAVLMLCYGSGLRSSEAVSVKITDTLACVNA
jgi:site-specific recombinase XerD